MPLQNNPVTIICSDGGLQGAFIGGAFAQISASLADDFPVMNEIFATSASVGSMFYFLSFGLHHGGRKIWTEDIPKSKFLRFNSWRSFFQASPIYDVSHLVDVVFKQDNPLDPDALLRSDIHFAFPVLDIDTRSIVIFSNRPARAAQEFPGYDVLDWRRFDVYELIKAACAVPILYDRPVIIGGRRYCDAGQYLPFLVPEDTVHGRAILIRTRRTIEIVDALKNGLASMLWMVRAAFGAAGLPFWVYGAIILKPRRVARQAGQFAKAFSQSIEIVPVNELRSSLTNSVQIARWNWAQGVEAARLRTADILKLLRR